MIIFFLIYISVKFSYTYLKDEADTLRTYVWVCFVLEHLITGISRVYEFKYSKHSRSDLHYDRPNFILRELYEYITQMIQSVCVTYRRN
jgi:hypothetical protein